MAVRGRGRGPRSRRGHQSCDAPEPCSGPPTSYNRFGYEHRRPRPLRRLQELRVGGEPVHHGVPVLRQPAAQARAEARSRRAALAERKRGRRRRRCRGCAPARSPGSAAESRRTRRSRSSWPASRVRCCGGQRSSAAPTRRAVGAARLGVVAAAHRPVHLRQHRLRDRGAWHDRALRLAARAPARPALVARAVRDRGVGGAAGPPPLDPPARARRQRRRARAAGRLGDAGPAVAPRPARRSTAT